MAIIGVILVALAAPLPSAAQGSTSVGDAFALDSIVIGVPVDTPGFTKAQDRPESLEGVYVVDGWVNLGDDARIALDDPPERIATTDEMGAPFRLLRRLLSVYRERDVDGFVELHEPSARSLQANKLSDPTLRQAWGDFVGAIEAIEPQILFAGDEVVACLFKAERRDPVTGDVQTQVGPIMFTEDYQLAGAGTSTRTSLLLTNLMLYLGAGGNNSAGDLVVNREYLESAGGP